MEDKGKLSSLHASKHASFPDGQLDASKSREMRTDLLEGHRDETDDLLTSTAGVAALAGLLDSDFRESLENVAAGVARGWFQASI